MLLCFQLKKFKSYYVFFQENLRPMTILELLLCITSGHPEPKSFPKSIFLLFSAGNGKIIRH